MLSEGGESEGEREAEKKEKDGKILSKTREKGSKAMRTKMGLGETEGRRCVRLC